MKKHQLLEKAMRDYPAGTVARFKSAPNTDHTSDGIFQVLDINHDESIGVYSGSGLNCFYISHDENGKFINQWAEVVNSEPIVVSFEGNNLFKGDPFYVVDFDDNEKGDVCGDYKLNNWPLEGYKITPEFCFSTKEAALTWCEEQNKPKDIVIPHTGGNVTVNKLAVTFNTGEKCFSAKYFKKIVEAFQSLQCDKTAES